MSKTIEELKNDLNKQLESGAKGKICVEDGPKDTGERYFLAELDGGNPLICFGINPSTANADEDDPTIKRIRSIADAHGMDGWIMLNLYPQRATDPDNLHKECNQDLDDRNNAVISEVFRRFPQSKVLAAWGNLIEKRGYLRECLGQILKLDEGREWYLLGTPTNSGNPRHPLYVKADTPLVPFENIRGQYGL